MYSVFCKKYSCFFVFCFFGSQKDVRNFFQRIQRSSGCAGGLWISSQITTSAANAASLQRAQVRAKSAKFLLTNSDEPDGLSS